MPDDVAEKKRTRDELTASFNALLCELEETPTELAKRMKHMGDHRSLATILRSIHRMLSGEAGVSGEMLVLTKLLVRQQRARDERYAGLRWTRFPNGTHTANVDGFTITLSPQTKGRWQIHLVHDQTRYSPEWPAWQPCLDVAKKKALTCIADAQNELAELQNLRPENTHSEQA